LGPDLRPQRGAAGGTRAVPGVGPLFVAAGAGELEDVRDRVGEWHPPRIAHRRTLGVDRHALRSSVTAPVAWRGSSSTRRITTSSLVRKLATRVLQVSTVDRPAAVRKNVVI